MKKYELTEESIVVNKRIVYRIKALRDDFNCNVEIGDLGGFVESEANLSQDGASWIFDDAVVMNNAVVKEDASVSGDAIVRDSAIIAGNTEVHHNAQIEGTTVITDGSIGRCAFIRTNHDVVSYPETTSALATQTNTLFCHDTDYGSSYSSKTQNLSIYRISYIQNL